MRTTFFVSIVLAALLLSVSVADAGVIGKPANQLGLVGYWSFNEGSGTVAGDSSGKRNTGTTTNTPTWTYGKVSNALQFAGAGDYVDVANTPALSPAHVGTVSVWIKDSVTQFTTQVAVSKFDCGADVNGFNLGKDNIGRIFFTIAGGVDNMTVTSDLAPVYTDLQWHHVVGVWDGSLVYLYVDGVSVSVPASQVSDPVTNLFDVTIGSCAGADFEYDGTVDEVRVYNRALSASEVVTLYKGGSTGVGAYSAQGRSSSLANGLVGHWTLDGADVTDKVYDKSGLGNHGYLRGGATTSAKVLGKLGQSIRFNGTNQSIDVGSATSLDDLDTITISAWIKPDTNFTGAREIYAKVNDGGSFTDGPDFWYDPATSNRLWFAQGFTGGGGYGAWYVDTSPLVLGKWQHVAVVYSRASASNNPAMYINGVLQTTTADVSQPAIGTARTDAGADAVIGAYGTINVAGFFLGSIDDVRVYSRMLSASEIKQLYNLGSQRIGASSNTLSSGGLNSGLVGHWTFDGADITTSVQDVSGGGNHGGFVGAGTSTAKVIGRHGQALNFNGSSSFVEGLGTTLPQGSNFLYSMSMWVYLRSNGGTNYLLEWGNAGDTGNPALINIGQSWRAAVYGGCNADVDNNPDLNKWVNLVVTYDGTNQRFYRDGVLIAGPTACSPSTSAQNFRIGAQINTNVEANFFDGKVDDVRIYDRALTAREAQQLYNLGR